MEGIKYTRVEYSKTFSLGNYENERIGLTAEVPEGADMLAVYNQLRNDVEGAHLYRRDLNEFNRAQQVVNDEFNHLGREVSRAKDVIEKFYDKYPFHRPNDVATALQLAEAPVVEYKDAKESWEKNA